MQLSIKRQECWVRGLLARIEARNVGKTWSEQITEPTYATNEDGEPFLIVESWEQVRELAALAGIKSRDENYPDLDNRVNYGFSDEYTTCSHCGKLIRTSPDSYYWQPDFLVGDGEISCADCLESDAEGVIEQVKNTDTPLPPSIDASAYGWVRLNDESCESGFFPGQNDNPKTFKRALENAGIDYLFRIDEPSQFYTRWSVWVPEDSVEVARKALG